LKVTCVSEEPPFQVLKLVQQTVPDNVHGNEVLVRWVSTPIDPLDIGIINGKYPSVAPPPCIGGSEGLGVVEKVGIFVVSSSRLNWVSVRFQ
uniref:Enoyl-[acyl-carrier-protein] reductase, mitochondrial n=1 Tax=Anisakis simplex TaxID=6269 RepID=A0A0M3JD27_ANISI